LTFSGDDAIVVYSVVEEELSRDEFEARLGEECGKIRAEMESARQELRAEMTALRGEVHFESGVLRSELRDDMQQLRTDVRLQIADARSDLIKWSFLFWVGQVAVVSGLLSLLR
jgi:hypothetical protein